MGTSRVQKFKEYRDSLIKEGAPVLNTTQNDDIELGSSINETTSTLPLDEVISALEQENNEADFIKKAKKRRIISYAIFGGIVAVIIALIIVFAVLVF
jgi:t-SNARE complex subunit (syntaxin)